MRKKEGLERELLLADDDSSSTNADVVDHSNENNCQTCDNCHRRQSQELLNVYGSLYELQFHEVCSTAFKRRTKFKTFSLPRTTITQKLLCMECTRYLTCDDDKIAEKNAWPSFVWKVLCDDKVKS